MTDEPVKTKSKRWVKILLVVSLGLNLTIASFVVGMMIKGPRGAPQNQDAVAFLSFALPSQHRREIRRELVNHRAEFRATRDALRGLRVEMIGLLQEEPFDIKKVAHLLERQRANFLSMGELAHDALLRRIADLTPQEREIYVRSLQRNAQPKRPSN